MGKPLSPFYAELRPRPQSLGWKWTSPMTPPSRRSAFRGLSSVGLLCVIKGSSPLCSRCLLVSSTFEPGEGCSSPQAAFPLHPVLLPLCRCPFLSLLWPVSPHKQGKHSPVFISISKSSFSLFFPRHVCQACDHIRCLILPHKAWSSSGLRVLEDDC